MKEYFYKKEYKYMYLSTISYNFANALIGTFGTVMLYKAGIPIYLNQSENKIWLIFWLPKKINHPNGRMMRIAIID